MFEKGADPFSVAKQIVASSSEARDYRVKL